MTAVKSILRVLHRPTDEYEEIKYRRTWNVWAACIALAAWFAVTIADRQPTGFIFNRNNLKELNVLFLFASTVVLFCLYTAINWAVTHPAGGQGNAEGNFSVPAPCADPYHPVHRAVCGG